MLDLYIIVRVILRVTTCSYFCSYFSLWNKSILGLSHTSRLHGENTTQTIDEMTHPTVISIAGIACIWRYWNATNETGLKTSLSKWYNQVVFYTNLFPMLFHHDSNEHTVQLLDALPLISQDDHSVKQNEISLKKIYEITRTVHGKI